MDIRRELRRYGGVARRAELVAAIGRLEFDRAVAAGDIRRVNRGLYTADRFPDQGTIVARGAGGVLSHLAAAKCLSLGLTVHTERWDVTIPIGAKRTSAPDGAHFHFADLPADDVQDGCTTPLRTVVDCLRQSPVHLALAVLESAVASHRASLADLNDRIRALRGPGSARARTIFSWYDPRASPPLESALRGILLNAGIDRFQPQFEVWDGGRKVATTDLGDAASRILLEADSFLNHGSRDQLANDAARYNKLVALGYQVLRFTYPPIAAASDWVVSTVRSTLAHQDRP